MPRSVPDVKLCGERDAAGRAPSEDNSVSKTYLNWVIENTPTKWWHDSAETAELELGLQRGAIGVTTNPFLANIAVNKNRALWGRRSMMSSPAIYPVN